MGSKRLTIREQRRKNMQRQRMMTIIIVVGIALLLFAVLLLPTLRNALGPVGEVIPASAGTIYMPDGNTMGDPDAPVVIVEFSDFQCPACKVFHDQTFKPLVDAYIATGKVRFEYRSMGNWLGAESVSAARAAYCASEQEKFWEYHSVLFANQGVEGAGSFSTRRLQAMAEHVGLNMDDFNSCYSSNRYNDRINQDQLDGRQAGVTGTPAFLVNGKLIPGAVTFATMASEIDAALLAAGVPLDQ
jgi:protein-disulfide isomerase